MAQGKESFPAYLSRISNKYCKDVPSVVHTRNFVDDMVRFLFPVKTGNSVSAEQMERTLHSLKERFVLLLSPLKKEMKKEPDEIARLYFDVIPEVFRKLQQDADAFVKFDPAARCVEEVILCYPGFYAITVYRLAHELYRLEVPLLPRIMCEYAHSETGVDIHPGAQIGNGFFIDHGTGTVIGETTVIGENVKIYQGVTLGALFVRKKMAHKKRHPTIEDNVIIYARSTILGGDTVIGHDTVVGGNVWITGSILPHSVVYQKHNTRVRDNRKTKF